MSTAETNPMCTGNCSAGYFCQNASTSTPPASTCLPGRYSLSGASWCSLCPAGRWGAYPLETSPMCTGLCSPGYVLLVSLRLYAPRSCLSHRHSCLSACTMVSPALVGGLQVRMPSWVSEQHCHSVWGGKLQQCRYWYGSAVVRAHVHEACLQGRPSTCVNVSFSLACPSELPCPCLVFPVVPC